MKASERKKKCGARHEGVGRASERAMSSSGNSKRASGGTKDERKNASSKEESPVTGRGDEGSGSTGGGASADGTPQPGSKPGSAGASSREAVQKLLALAARGEWAPVDQLLKSLEKAAQNVGEDGGPLLPLASVMDPVGRQSFLLPPSLLLLFHRFRFLILAPDFQGTGMTPLMYAVKDNRTALLDRMIELGADLGARNNASISKKHLSTYQRHQRLTFCSPAVTLRHWDC